MRNKSIVILLVSFLLVSSVDLYAQPAKRKSYPYKYNLDPYDEKLKKISIRLEFGDWFSKKDNSKFRFAQDEELIIRVLARVSDQRTIALGFSHNYWVIPLLFGKGGTALPYSLTAQERIKQKLEQIEQRKNPNAIVIRESGPGVFISPNQENAIGRINIADWFGKLAPGTYKFMVKFGFTMDEKENRIESQSIIFEIY